MADRVIAYSGCSAPETPIEFYVADERHIVAEVVSTWLEQTEDSAGPTLQVWSVVDGRGEEYLISYRRSSDEWHITPRGGRTPL